MSFYSTQPLAERLRPHTLDFLVGQQDLLNPSGPLKTMIENQSPQSMIFWGPPGCGKTTLARIIAKSCGADIYEISAIAAGIKEIRAVLDKARENQVGLFQQATLLFIDEIHRFNKAQQDALLKSVETGEIILIGATTENPSFEVIPALLSRCVVYTLQSLSKEALSQLLERAIASDPLFRERAVELKEIDALLAYASGDARILLNTFEMVYKILSKQTSQEIVITNQVLEKLLQRKLPSHDKGGESHYNLASALIKSVRGSDPDAALYYLARLLEGGEKPEFIARRLIILASEDIGNAEPFALGLATSCMQAVHFVGMPEARIILAQTITYLAACPKSNAAYLGVEAALADVRNHPDYPVPLHLRNAPTALMKNLNYGQGYRYSHDYPDHFVVQNYFPTELGQPIYYHPTELGREKFFKQRLEDFWPQRRTEHNES